MSTTDNSSCNLDVSFLVDNLVYSYAFVGGRSKLQLYVVVSVTAATEVNAAITTRDIESAWIDYYAEDILKFNCIERNGIVAPSDADLSNFTSIINFSWDNNLKCRTQDLHIKLIDNLRVWVVHRLGDSHS